MLLTNSLSWFFIPFFITPMPVKKLEAGLSNYRDSFLMNLNRVKATAEFSIRNPTRIFPIIRCLISGLYAPPLTTARILYAGRGGEEEIVV